MSVRARFFANVRRVPSGCWEWTASVDGQGYGWFSGLGERKAHRASFVLHKGAIPKGFCVLHSCDNPRCVNPAHLSIGSATRNQAEKAARGRAKGLNVGDLNGMRTSPQSRPTGTRNGASKLTPASVREIRTRALGGAPVSVLAREFGVSRAAINDVIERVTWADVV